MTLSHHHLDTASTPLYYDVAMPDDTRMTLRLPKGLYEDLAVMARAEHRSLNGQIVALLWEYVYGQRAKPAEVGGGVTDEVRAVSESEREVAFAAEKPWRVARDVPKVVAKACPLCEKPLKEWGAQWRCEGCGRNFSD